MGGSGFYGACPDMGVERIVVPKSVPFGRARNDNESQGIALKAEVDHAKSRGKRQKTIQ